MGRRFVLRDCRRNWARVFRTYRSNAPILQHNQQNWGIQANLATGGDAGPQIGRERSVSSGIGRRFATTGSGAGGFPRFVRVAGGIHCLAAREAVPLRRSAKGGFRPGFTHRCAKVPPRDSPVAGARPLGGGLLDFWTAREKRDSLLQNSDILAALGDRRPGNHSQFSRTECQNPLSLRLHGKVPKLHGPAFVRATRTTTALPTATRALAAITRVK